MRINLFLLYAMSLLGLMSCQNKQPDLAALNQSLIEADVAFAHQCEKEGMKKSFMAYAHDSTVLLRPNHLPIIGKKALSDFLSSTPDSTFSLTWKPKEALVAKSGELGFTFGLYKMIRKDTLLKGTYVSVWKKDPMGNWKFILDSGNEGIGK